MSTWSPQNAVITNLGNSLLASARVGLGTIQLTKVIARENFESSITAIRAYTSEDIIPASVAQEGHLMTIRVSESPDPEEEVETSLVTVRFSNDDLEDSSETYNLRQIILFAVLLDPETHEAINSEVPYMVCQCDDSTDCDVMPAREVNPTSFDYDIYVIHAGVDDFTIAVRTEGYVWQEDFDDYKSEVENQFENLESDFNAKVVGQNNKDKTFTSWTPVYDSSREVWSQQEESEVVGLEGSESFNQIESAHLNSFATGKRSTTFGKGCEALAENSFAVGEDNYINGPSSLISGMRNSIKGGYGNFVSGSNNEVGNANYNTIFGYANVLSNEAFCTLLSGQHLIGGTSCATVLGKYNVNDTSKKYALIVGGGNNELSRENIFTVNWLGEIQSKTARHNAIYVDELYNLDGTPKEMGGSVDFISKGTGTKSFITNDLALNKASSPYASAFGKETKAEGYNSVSFNEKTTASGRNSVAMGFSSNAAGENSFAQGDGAVVNGKTSATLATDDSFIDAYSGHSVILGSQNVQVENPDTNEEGYNFVSNSIGVYVDNGMGNVVLGALTGTTIIQDSSFNFVVGAKELGNNNTITDSNVIISFADGDNSFSNAENIFAVGENISVSFADKCSLLGEGLEVTGTSSERAENQVVLGKWNKNDVSKALIIGNGSNTSRHNALTVDNEGNIFCNEDSTSLNTRIATNENNISKNKAALIELVDESTKNLLEHIAFTRTVNDVTYTVNADRSIQISSAGNNTQSLLYLVQNYTGVPAGNYVLSGCTGGSSTTYDLRVKVGNTTYINYDGGTEFYYNGTDNFESSIVVRASQTINTTIKPMICTKAEWDISQSYQPYRPNTMNAVFGPGTEIIGTDAEHQDLNSYTELGVYFCRNSTNAGYVDNKPVGGSGFRLTVENISGTNTFRQTFIKPTDPSKIYVRHYSTSTWSAWYVFEGTIVS